MEMDSEYCRVNAKRCIEMANDTNGTTMQSLLFQLAGQWTTWADELDADTLKTAANKIDPIKQARAAHRRASRPAKQRPTSSVLGSVAGP